MAKFEMFLEENDPKLLAAWKEAKATSQRDYDIAYNAKKRDEAMEAMGNECESCGHKNHYSLVFYWPCRPPGRKISSRQLYLGIIRGEYRDQVTLICQNCMFDYWISMSKEEAKLDDM